MKDKKLRAYSIGDWIYRFDPADLDAFERADRVMASAPPATHDVQRSADGAVPMLQREEAEPEEEDPDNLAAAQTFVQRHEDCAEHDW